MTTLAQDTAARANASSWGTCSDGVNTWGSPVNSTNATESIASNELVLSGTQGAGADVQVICGSIIAGTVNMLVRVSSSYASNLCGLLWRYTSTGGGSGYRCGFYGGNSFNVDKYTAGARANVTSFAFTWTVNTFYWIRLIHSSSTLQIRVWADGAGEPGTWNVNITENTYTSGNFGVSTYILNTTTISYDSYTVTDNSSSTHTITQQTRSSFKLRTTVVEQARANYKLRASIQQQARSRYQLRASISQRMTGKYWLRQQLTTQARSHYLLSYRLTQQARAHYTLAARVQQQARSQFKLQGLVQSNQQRYALSFLVEQTLFTSFAYSQNLTITTTKVPMIAPNSTINSAVTVTNANGATVTNLATVSVTVFFPDLTTQTFSLSGNTVSLVGNTYQISYLTKGPGIMREEWEVVGSDGSQSEAVNSYPVSF